MLLQQFRQTVYQAMRKRADGFLDLVDALTVAGHVNSPAALSEETPFRRKFSSIFDTLLQAEIDFDQLVPALYEHQPPESEKIAGYEVYGLEAPRTSVPKRRQRKRALERLSSSTENALPGRKKGENCLRSGFAKPLSLFLVYCFRFFRFRRLWGHCFAFLNSSIIPSGFIRLWASFRPMTLRLVHIHLLN